MNIKYDLIISEYNLIHIKSDSISNYIETPKYQKVF